MSISYAIARFIVDAIHDFQRPVNRRKTTRKQRNLAAMNNEEIPDESLEVGIAAGLDVPTAIVLSETTESRKPRKSQKNREQSAEFYLMVLVVIFCGFWELLSYYGNNR